MPGLYSPEGQELTGTPGLLTPGTAADTRCSVNISRMNGKRGWMMGAYYVLVSGIISSQCITSLYPQNNPCEVDAIMISKLQRAAGFYKDLVTCPKPKM